MLAAIRSPAHVLHGAEDRLVPVDHARRLAARIDGAQLHLLEREGHFLLHTHGDRSARRAGPLRPSGGTDSLPGAPVSTPEDAVPCPR